jgi:hypothetical protein
MLAAERLDLLWPSITAGTTEPPGRSPPYAAVVVGVIIDWWHWRRSQKTFKDLVTEQMSHATDKSEVHIELTRRKLTCLGVVARREGFEPPNRQIRFWCSTSRAARVDGVLDGVRQRNRRTTGHQADGKHQILRT